MSIQPRYRRRFCEAVACSNTSVNRVMFQFPGNQHKSKKWGESISMKPSSKKYRYLCSDHFEMWCFTDTFKRRLIKEACPTIQMLPDEEQACADLSDGSLPPLSEQSANDPAIENASDEDEMSLEKHAGNSNEYEIIEVNLLEVVDVACA